LAGLSAPARGAGSFLAAAFLCLTVLLVCMTVSDQLWHWFLLPVLCCGVLIGADAVDWVRARLGVFDPVGILGLFGWHFFFLVPLLHVTLDHWLTGVPIPGDQRDWLGALSVLNALGLLVYQGSRRYFEGDATSPRQRTVWVLDDKRFLWAIAVALVVTALLQAAVYAQFGGIAAYMDTATDVVARDQFQGMGWLFLISESFPLLAMMGFVVWARGKESCRTWLCLCAVLVVFFVLKLLFGGLRGSRSQTVWGLFVAVGLIHLCVRRVPRAFIYLGLLFLVAFMYIYGFYKGFGVEGLEAVGDAEAREELSARMHRGPADIIVLDLGRSDMQAFLLYKTTDPDSDYRYAWGRTYVGALALFIPRSLWPDRPDTITREGTEALAGMGSYEPGVVFSSHVHGLAGEAMLNFGPAAVPVAFLGLGLAVGRLRRFTRSARPWDSRWLLVPLLLNSCFDILGGDSCNILFSFVKDALIPCALVMAFSMRRPDPDRGAAPAGDLGARPAFGIGP
jgi:hypothetical protein